MTTTVTGKRSQESLRDPAAGRRALAAVVVLLLLWPGVIWTEFSPAVLFDPQNRQTIGHFLGTFLPPNFSPEFLRLIAKSTLETLALATAGMALAIAFALPLALIVARSLSISRIGPGPGRGAGNLLRTLVRFVLMVLRGIPEIVWALLFVRAVGLGPAAGVLAIAITYSGMLGKIYSEIFESGDVQPARVLLESGSGRLGSFFYGILPGALPELVSYTIYRWECAIRASVVMGFVGAGGLGQQMELSMRLLNGGEASTILLTFLLLVLLADAVSALLRRALT
ncbi:MAG: PhnE/PtxC family ABC transporter permease [Burkholderiales bacterium]|nr:ABC transporter permease subunit [Burkholderiales bacterium]MDQ3195646.1 ABC transporter permease subunit [Pseudomonadota bacterium]